MNVDGSPTKTEVLKARRNPETESYWQLSFGKRQEEELYNIAEDRECMANLAEDANYNVLKKTNAERTSTKADRTAGSKDAWSGGYI